MPNKPDYAQLLRETAATLSQAAASIEAGLMEYKTGDIDLSVVRSHIPTDKIEPCSEATRRISTLRLTGDLFFDKP